MSYNNEQEIKYKAQQKIYREVMMVNLCAVGTCGYLLSFAIMLASTEKQSWPSTKPANRYMTSYTSMFGFGPHLPPVYQCPSCFVHAHFFLYIILIVYMMSPESHLSSFRYLVDKDMCNW